MCKGVSIVICCYNSATRLEKTIDHIALQQVPDGLNWEVIVVNNASTDETFSLANILLRSKFAEERFHIVNEDLPGLSNARRKGIETAQFSYVLFCDDDNWLSTEYVRQVYDFLESRPDVGVVSGKTEAVFENTAPEWFKLIQKSYAVGKQASESGELEAVWGAGMALRKADYMQLMALGFRHLNSDRLQDKLYGGGDSEICLAISRMGYKIWYDENLFLKHFIPTIRLTFTYARLLYYYIGYSAPSLSVYREKSEDFVNGSYHAYWVKAAMKSGIRYLVTIIYPIGMKDCSRGHHIPKGLMLELMKGRIRKLLEWKGQYSKIRKEVMEAAWNRKTV